MYHAEQASIAVFTDFVGIEGARVQLVFRPGQTWLLLASEMTRLKYAVCKTEGKFEP